MYLQWFEDTWGIHAGYFQDTFWDTCISLSQMYPERYVSEMQDTCGIHARYMYICKGNQDTCGIHPRYMMRYMYLKFVPARIQARPQVGLEIRILECIPMYPTCIVSVSCVTCIWGLRYIVSWNVSWMYPKCILKKDKYPKVRYISIIAKEIDTNVSWCILVYLDVSWCIWTGHIKIHHTILQDTSRYIKIRIV